MKSIFKKTVYILLVMMVILTMLQGCGTNNNTPTQSTSKVTAQTSGSTGETASEAEKISKEKITVTYMTADNGFGYSNEMAYWQELYKRTNVLFDIKAVPPPYGEKVATLVASGDMADMTVCSSDLNPDSFSKSGAVVNLKEYEQYMPNFLKYAEKYPELIDSVAEADGKYFQTPCIYDWTWVAEGLLYRQDIFLKHNIQIPRTIDQFEAVLRQLKQLYPNSYPLECVWGSSYSLGHFANAFNTGISAYFNLDTGKYQFGPMEDNYKLLIEKLSNWYKDGLLDPQWDKLPDEDWKKNMFEDKAFIGWHYVDFAKRLNLAAASAYPNVKITTMAPPAMKEGEKARVATIANVYKGGVMLASKSKYIVEMVKVLDYLFSPEGVILNNWGIEGVTYTKNADGTFKYTDTIAHVNNLDINNAKQKWDFAIGGIPSVTTFDATAASDYTKEVVDGFNDVLEHSTPILSRQIPQVKFTDEEKEQLKNLETPLKTYTDEMTSKFVTGREPLSSWDAYVKKIKDMNVDKILEIYNNAAQRAKRY